MSCHTGTSDRVGGRVSPLLTYPCGSGSDCKQGQGQDYGIARGLSQIHRPKFREEHLGPHLQENEIDNKPFQGVCPEAPVRQHNQAQRTLRWGQARNQANQGHHPRLANRHKRWPQEPGSESAVGPACAQLTPLRSAQCHPG